MKKRTVDKIQTNPTLDDGGREMIKYTTYPPTPVLRGNTFASASSKEEINKEMSCGSTYTSTPRIIQTIKLTPFRTQT